jgi:hypothetical protein
LISADFNQDGLSDLAVETSEGVGIFLANSNGQFTKTKQNLGFGNAYPFPPAVGDFNGDKIPDIIGVNPSNHDIDFLVGIGGGNFANLSGPPAGENPGYIAVGDFNGDGRQDFAAGNVWLSENGSAAATLTGISPNDSGRPSIIATYVGDSTYSPATASPLVLRATPAINLSPSANPLANGSSVQLTASVSGNGTTPSGKVRFMSGALELATVTLKSGFASFSTPALAVGQYSFKAIYDGDAFYGPLTSLAVDEVVNKAPQTISFPSLPKDDNYPVGSSIQLAATATSGLPITYQVTGHAIVTGSTLTFLAPGAVAITSYQDGNADYNPAKPVEQTVVVKPAR